MKFLKRFESQIRNLLSDRKKKRKIYITGMAASSIVCFVVVYMLIQPALTIEKQDAQKMPGISIDQEEAALDDGQVEEIEEIEFEDDPL